MQAMGIEGLYLQACGVTGCRRFVGLVFRKDKKHKFLINHLLGFIFVLLCFGNGQAGLLEDTCAQVYRKLASGPFERLTKTNEGFNDWGKHYHGCVIRLTGNAKIVTDAQRPGTLFGQYLPFCLVEKMPPDLLNEKGWCGDRMRDGADGTFYRALKDNIFCLVKGNWDGGDDSDPGYAPSTRYDVVVKCAERR